MSIGLLIILLFLLVFEVVWIRSFFVYDEHITRTLGFIPNILMLIAFIFYKFGDVVVF